MENKEVIKNLQYLISEDCTDTQMDYVEEIEIAIKAIKKQTPKKPKMRKAGSDCVGFYCPCCNQHFVSEINGELIAGQKYKYCYNCGKKIDWGE